MIQCYALFWLFFSTIIFRAFLKQTAQETRRNPNELESLAKSFSAKAFIRQFLITSAIVYAFDIAGMILVYGHTELRSWQLILFFLVVAAIGIDGLMDCHKLRQLVRTDSDQDLLARLQQYMSLDTNPLSISVGAIAVGGKVLLAVLLVLWTVFP